MPLQLPTQADMHALTHHGKHAAAPCSGSHMSGIRAEVPKSHAGRQHTGKRLDGQTGISMLQGSCTTTRTALKLAGRGPSHKEHTPAASIHSLSCSEDCTKTAPGPCAMKALTLTSLAADGCPSNTGKGCPLRVTGCCAGCRHVPGRSTSSHCTHMCGTPTLDPVAHKGPRADWTMLVSTCCCVLRGHWAAAHKHTHWAACARAG